jgi:hypothetical protein
MEEIQKETNDGLLGKIAHFWIDYSIPKELNMWEETNKMSQDINKNGVATLIWNGETYTAEVIESPEDVDEDVVEALMEKIEILEYDIQTLRSQIFLKLNPELKPE